MLSEREPGCVCTGALFQGQRICIQECSDKKCALFSASAADPFNIEEVYLDTV